MFLKNKAYDATKYVAQIALPAVGTLYFALSQIWGLPSGAEVVGTITAVDAFLGVLLGLSSKAYNNSPESHDGYIGATGVDPDTGNPDVKLTFTKLPSELMDKGTVRLKVGTPPEPKDVG